MLDINNLEIYDSLVFPKNVEIPRRSHLFHLEPIGVGTQFTESLSSYLCRLAQEHCVTPQKLIMGEIAPLLMGDKYDIKMLSKNVSTLFGNSDGKPALNGMREMTKSLVDALEKLTLRQNLKCLSCLSWKGIIKERGLFRQNKAWCPQCFEQWKKEEKDLYEPLIWSFNDVDFCPQHQCQLIENCPNCGSSLKVIANYLQLGFCYRCKAWLGISKSENHALLIDDFESEFQIIRGISDLIAVTSELNLSPTLPNLTRKLQLIHFCFERVVNQDLTKFLTLGKIMEQLKITLTQHYDKPLHLTKLLIPVCVHAKISVVQFLREDFQTLSAILFRNLEINYQL